MCRFRHWTDVVFGETDSFQMKEALIKLAVPPTQNSSEPTVFNVVATPSPGRPSSHSRTASPPPPPQKVSWNQKAVGRRKLEVRFSSNSPIEIWKRWSASKQPFAEPLRNLSLKSWRAEGCPREPKIENSRFVGHFFDPL